MAVKDSLPKVIDSSTAEILRNLAAALYYEDLLGEASMLRMVRLALTRIRNRRIDPTSTPGLYPGRQPDIIPGTLSDRALIRRAIIEVVWADGTMEHGQAMHLMVAEANLRTLIKRHPGERR